jgi:hypothetical protein
MSSTVTYGSEAIKAEVEALEAEIAALRAKYAKKAAYYAEMDRVHDLLRKYRHRWCVYNAAGERQEPSRRMNEWVDRYAALAGSIDLFYAWCDDRGHAIHDAYDVLS